MRISELILSKIRAIFSAIFSDLRSLVRSSATFDGVEARTSQAKSHKVSSISWPIPQITGIFEAATARTRASSLKQARSSLLPPPRMSAITSTSVLSLKYLRALMICSGASKP